MGEQLNQFYHIVAKEFYVLPRRTTAHSFITLINYVESFETEITSIKTKKVSIQP